jgi:hypothetical protein
MRGWLHIAALALLTTTLSATAPAVLAQKVQEVTAAEFAAKQINFTPVNLESVANRGFKDEVAGDNQGGWTDQGANSLVGVPTGRQIFAGVPFLIPANAQRQVAVLRGQNKEAYPTRVEVPINAKAAGIYFLHAAAWLGEVAGTYTVEYSDGKKEEIRLRKNIEIFDWWSPTSSDVMRVGWKGANAERDPIGLGMLAWANPHPDVIITRIVAQTTGDAAFVMLGGITLADAGPFLQQVPPKQYDTADWFTYEGVDVAKRRGTALDMSYLLDAPAGKHGWVRRQGENFVFENGTKVKFWGTNIVASANFPTHAEAERIAETLAQMGVNMTRHHHADAPWANPNIFGNKENTLHLDPEALDRFDYFIAQLQKRGIYQYFDLLVHRAPLATDGVRAPEDVTNGYKIEGEFDHQLIGLQESFTRQLLGHKNPYTGKTYGHDPAVALMEIINEDSLFYRNGNTGDFGITTEYYQRMWQTLWNTWLVEKFGNRAALEKRWASSDTALKSLAADEDPTRGTVVSIGKWEGDEYKGYSRQRVLDNFRFYYDLQMRYFRRIESLVRELGSKAPITGSNHWVSFPADLYANAQLDYIDRHDYWAHPEGGYGYAPGVSFNATSMTKNARGGLIGGLAYRRVSGYPYIVTEWQTSAPNDYRQEGMLFMSAYCAFQNWSATQFSYSHGLNYGEVLNSNFDVHNQPGMMGAWPFSSLIVHRGDVRESPVGYFQPLSNAQVFDPATRIKVPEQMGMVAKTGIDFTGRQSRTLDLDALTKRQVQGKRAVSVTGELTFDSEQGHLMVNTPRTQGFTGFSGGKTANFSNLQVQLQNTYGMVVASALERKPLNQSRRILLSAIGNAMNTGMAIDESGSRVRETGTAPVLVEPMRGTVRLLKLRGDLSKVVVYHLNPSGQRVGRVPVLRSGNALIFEMKPDYKTMHYEVVR